MNTNSTKQVIGYLSPALPALSETFVYEELLALRDRGVEVVPFSVRKPELIASAQLALADQTINLYSKLGVLALLHNFLRLFMHGMPAWQATRYLFADIWECGPLRRSTWKLAYQFLASVKLAGLLKQHHCTHLHVHFAHVPSQIAMYASAMSGVPFTIMAHANDIFDHGMLLRQKCNRASAFLTISEFNRSYLEHIGLDANKLTVVRCGVSFKPRVAKSQARDNNTYKLGSLGRMVEKKGFDILLQSVAMLTKQGVQVQLSLAGDGPLMESLEVLTKELGIKQQVQFLGKMNHHEVAKWLQDLDVFVLACKKDKNGDMDGIPVVLMEAMSQSIPVVSTRISGIPELVLHEQTGLLADPGSSVDLTSQISRLLLNPELRTRLTSNALEHVMLEFGQSKNIDRLMQYFVH